MVQQDGDGRKDDDHPAEASGTGGADAGSEPRGARPGDRAPDRREGVASDAAGPTDPRRGDDPDPAPAGDDPAGDDGATRADDLGAARDGGGPDPTSTDDDGDGAEGAPGSAPDPDDGEPSPADRDALAGEPADPPGGPEALDPRPGAGDPLASASPMAIGAGQGIGLVPPVAMGSSPDGDMMGSSPDGDMQTDGGDPLMPPTGATPASDRPFAGAAGGPIEAPEDAREPDGADDPGGARDRDDAGEPVAGGPALDASPAAPSMPIVARAGGRGDPEPDPRDEPRAETPAPERPAPPPEARRGGGGGGAFATFLLSVLAAGAVAYGVLWWFDRRDADGAQEIEVVRLETEEAVAELEARLGERLGGIEAGSAELAARLEEGGDAPDDELLARLDALDQRLADADGRFGELEAGAEGAAGVDARLAEIAERVDALYAGQPEDGAPVADDALAPLRQALAAQDQRLGEIAGRLDDLDARLADLPDLSGRVESLAGEVEDLSGEIAPLGDIPERVETLSGDVEGLSGSLQPLSDLPGRVETLAGEVETLRGEAQSGRDALSQEIADLRQSAQSDREALRGEVEALRSTAEGQQARLEDEVAQARAEADAEATQARAQATLARMSAAIEAGTPYDAELTELLGFVDTPVPATLLNEARAGVPSLPQLRETFPARAREALLAAPTAGGGRVEGFFRRQLGVRSLEAREGDDVDAILSRAEATLAEGDLEATLAELEALPEEARAPLQEWIASAEDRVIIRDAATELASQLEAG